MNRIWIVARHEYATNVRRVGFLLFTFGVPLLGAALLIITSLFSGQVGGFVEDQFVGDAGENQKVGVVDESGRFTPLLPDYREQYEIFEDKEAGREALRGESVDRLLVVPPDYLESGRVRVVSKGEPSGPVYIGLESAGVYNFLVDHLLRDRASPELRDRVAEPFRPVEVSLDGEDTGGGFVGSFFSYILSLLLVVTIFISAGYLLQGVSKEKTSRIVEIIISSITPRQLLIGKIIGFGALGLTQVLIWFGSFFVLGLAATAVFSLSGGSPFASLLGRPEVFVLAVVYYVLGFLLYAVVIGSVGSLGTSMQESQQLSGVFSIIAAVPIFFAGIVLSNPNATLAKFFSYIPFTSPTMMLLRIPQGGVPLLDIVISIVGLVVTVLVVLWAGNRVFRLGLLMYDQRPGLKRVLKTLRQG
jgi:ABC-2 type transport system permease protein